jgi:hypothetical protein
METVLGPERFTFQTCPGCKGWIRSAQSSGVLRIMVAARNERLEMALSNLRQSHTSLTELATVWQKTEGSSFWWDDYRKVICAAARQEAYAAIFGSCGALRSFANVSKRSIKSPVNLFRQLFLARRWVGPIDVGLCLPGDAVLIPPNDSKRGMVIVSPGAGVVLKLTYGRLEVEREIKNWNIVKSAGIDNHVPRLLDHGSVEDGGQWLVTEFVPNTEPIDRPLNPFANKQRIWRSWLRRRVLPVMERFYAAAGLEILEVDEALHGTATTLREERMPAPMFKVLALAEKACGQSAKKRIVFTTIHKDIVPEHIHRSGDNWWLLDWGSTGRGLTCKEFFRDYFWTGVSQELNKRAFWAWLRGEIGVVRSPKHLCAEIDVYSDWYTAWQKDDLDPESLRCQLLISLLNDYRDVIAIFDLRDRLMNLEQITALPRWVHTLKPQLRALKSC